MSHGGARNRSGPTPDPRRLSLPVLPAAGYAGAVPDWPLEDFSPREREVWAAAWRTPQACAWALPSELWRTRTIAMWVRLSVRCESPDAPASLLAQLHRFADQIGMTTAGLAEMGWMVAREQGSNAQGESLTGWRQPTVGRNGAKVSSLEAARRRAEGVA